MLLLSIIVPIYKVEPYLRKCVDSLLVQDLSPEEYEIILVDDGSPDDCGKIADEYAARFSNVRAIHQENGGLSVARNTGIMAAQGKYIQFVDSDDYLEPNVLGALVERAERDNLDVLRFNYRNVNENYEEFWPNKTPKQTWGYEESVVDGVTFLNERLGYACYAVQFLILKELLADCLFKPNIYFEDVEWTPRMLQQARRVSSTQDVVYNYLSRTGSITKADDIDKYRKLVESKISLISDLQEQMQSCPDNRWYKGMISGTMVSVLGLLSGKLYKEKRTFLNKLFMLDVLPLSTYQMTKTGTRKARLINISPRIACLLLHLKNG